jgi:RsiW-degrading membrane proteinase PrsW (M82 family)
MSWSVDPAPIGSAIGLPRPRLDDGRGRTALIWAVALLAVVGMVGVVWLALRAGDVGGAAAALILAAIPVPFLIAAYLWLDRYEPEPTRFVAAALLWGAVISTFGAGLVQELLARIADPPEWVAVVVVAPVFEELLKGTLVVLVLVRRRRVSRLLDGFVYAGLVGVGFAFTENVLYISGAYAGLLVPEFAGPQAAGTVFALRGLISPFAHPLFTTAIGIGMAVAVATSRRWLRYLAPLVGYAVAVGLHATWNGSTMLLEGLGFLLTYAGFMVPLFAVAVYVAIRALKAEAAVIRTALLDAASRGWLHPAEVHWLVNYGDRAAARRFAGQVAGRPAAKALHAYQRAATEMALMHDRLLRGRAPDDGPARVEAHLRRMHSWRPYVVLPPLDTLPRQLQLTEGQPLAR